MYQIAVGVCLLLSVGVCTAESYKRPVIVPLPDRVQNVRNPVVSLNGIWKFSLSASADLLNESIDSPQWKDIIVPGEPWMQGFRIERDKEYLYKKMIEIPKDFSAKRILLRFDGVYSSGRVWVNGEFAGQHYGGFQSWNLDITDLVTPGANAEITVGIIDKTYDLSFGSGYASRYLGVNDVPHYIGGILRNVSLIAVPDIHISSLNVVTALDDDYRDAVLATEFDIANAGESYAEDVVCRFSLANVSYKKGNPVSGKFHQIAKIKIPSIKGDSSGKFHNSVSVKAPRLWDAEHPELYDLRAELLVKGRVVETLSKRIGFREVKVVGTKLLVNGKPVKLRGGCRHNVHPVWGRAYLPELAEKDIRLYKDANINYIRTSHYPTSTHFLELCDRFGIYVEEEMAIVWLDHGAAKGKLNDLRDDPKTLPYFMRAISETLERDKSHPSIVMWSIGNENVKWGKNFEKERDYARVADPTRPLKTGHNHYAGGWNTAEYLDIDSLHYPGWNTDFKAIKSGKPFLADEYAHVMCYYGKNSIAGRDPNVRNFWGESLKRLWDSMYEADTVLGGAIWGTIDEVFLCPERAVGYGRWGIFDGWRRKKPEYWNTKKVYSPVQIANKPLGNPGSGQPLKIAVQNRFDHTDFNELDILWKVGKDHGTAVCDLPPGGTRGELILPARDWQDSDEVELTFSSPAPVYSYTVDSFKLPLTAHPGYAGKDGASVPTPELRNDGDRITVAGKSFSLIFSRQSGQIVEAVAGGERLLIGGPVLNLSPLQLPPLAVESCASCIEPQSAGKSAGAHITVKGSYGDIGIEYSLFITGDGYMDVEYTVTRPPSPKQKYDEVGIMFLVPQRVNRLSWERKGLWSVYPQDHIGRNRGIAVKVRPGSLLKYRDEPSWPWYQDMNDFHLLGKNQDGYGMTHDFRAAKEYIYWEEIYREGAPSRLRIESDGKTHAVRMAKVYPAADWLCDDRHASVHRSGKWNEFSDSNDISGTELYSNHKGSFVECSFSGTSVRWIGARNNNLGKADVYIDGVCVARGVDGYAPRKEYQQALFEKTGLADKEHVIRIVVTGEKAPASLNTYVLADAFSDVVTDDILGVHINKEWAYRLSWGNYDRHVKKLKNGFSDKVRLKL